MDIATFFLLTTLVVVARAQLVTIIRPDPIPPGRRVTLDPIDYFDYPERPADILWKFSQDIEIEVKRFEVDGQTGSGDFLLVSQHDFPATPNEGEIDMSEFLQRLPVDELMFLSWNTEEDQLIRLVNSQGVFIYFHAEGTGRLPFLGFELEVRAFDRNPQEPTTTTQEPPTVPPGQQTDDYVTKFVTGKIPNQFLADLDIFKSTLADMTNKYCEEKGIQRMITAVPSDVHVPVDEIRFCDRSWPTFKQCVEVTFAIVTYDLEGYYVMTKPRIEEMWTMYSNDLDAYGFSAYDPPKSARRTVGWVWVVGCLGSVLVISIILCLAWLKKASDALNKDAEEISKAMAPVTDEEKFYDRGNPVHQIRKTMVNGKLTKEEEYRREKQAHEFSVQSFIPSFNEFSNSDTSSGGIFRVNQMYVPDDDEEEEEYFRKPNPISNPPGWHEHLQKASLHRQTDFVFEEDEFDEDEEN